MQKNIPWLVEAVSGGGWWDEDKETWSHCSVRGRDVRRCRVLVPFFPTRPSDAYRSFPTVLEEAQEAHFIDILQYQ